jgi:hypothetical protein
MAWHKVNSLDVQLDEFPISDKQASKQDTSKGKKEPKSGDRRHKDVFP